MTLELVLSGSLVMNGSEQPLFPSQAVGLLHYSTKIFFDEMEEGDEITIRVFDEDVDASTEKIYRTERVQGPQKSNRLVNWIPSSSYRVTCEQTSGSFKTITFALYSS